MPLARRTCRGQAGAPPSAWPAPDAAAAHPNGAKLRRGAPYPRLAAGLARPAHHAAPQA